MRSFTHENGALDNRFKLAYIARPVIFLEGFQGAFLDAFNPFAEFLIILCDKEGYQIGDVFFSLP